MRHKKRLFMAKQPSEFNKYSFLLGFIVLIGSLSAVNYTNYTAPNVTGLAGAFDYSAGVMESGTGNLDAFGLLVLSASFLGFYILGSRYTQERAIVFACFMMNVVAFLMVSGNFLTPSWLIATILMLLASVYLANRVG
jgi:hypothetical protein